MRAALGYERINLYGVSYGTRVAQHYLRRFPARVRAVILDGVVPPQLVIGPAIALDAESALRGILARCAAEAPCRARFGDPQDDYQRAARERCAQRAVPVALPDPATGERRHLEFDLDHLASVLRLGELQRRLRRAAAADAARRAARADYAPLAAQFLLLQRCLRGRSPRACTTACVCAEDVPFYDTRAIDRARAGGRPSWARRPVDGLAHDLPACGRAGRWMRTSTRRCTSAVPALLLSGSDDPVTPPAYAQQAAAGFAHARAGRARRLRARAAHRAVHRTRAGAVPRRARASRRSTCHCTALARPMPFFTSLNGPPP